MWRKEYEHRTIKLICGSRSNFGKLEVLDCLDCLCTCLQHNTAPVHKAIQMNTWLGKAVMKELQCLAQIPVFDPTEHLCDEPEIRLQPSSPYIRA